MINDYQISSFFKVQLLWPLSDIKRFCFIKAIVGKMSRSWELWLVSETFGLEQARSKEAEEAIEAAEAFMRGDGHLPKGLGTKAAIHARLQKLLPAGDVFWPRWIVSTQLQGAAAAKGKK